MTLWCRTNSEKSLWSPASEFSQSIIKGCSPGTVYLPSHGLYFSLLPFCCCCLFMADHLRLLPFNEFFSLWLACHPWVLCLCYKAVSLLHTQSKLSKTPFKSPPNGTIVLFNIYLENETICFIPCVRTAGMKWIEGIEQFCKIFDNREVQVFPISSWMIISLVWVM